MPEPNRPFRWDPVRPDHLGTLPADPPDLWYVDDLVECAGQVLARCADSDLYLVGRSADSVFDLLSGALEHTTWRDRLHQVPLSVFGSYRVSGDDLPHCAPRPDGSVERNWWPCCARNRRSASRGCGRW